MIDLSIYKDISERTGGDIYIGVVGPVRSGKSTFITKFMNMLVLPNIEEGSKKQRIIDELPQSGDGRVVMTTQPKFVPDGGVKIKIEDNVQANIRLIDCVGYPYKGIKGFEEDNVERQILTPWSDKEMTFSEAARLGTQKVMQDHSTIGVVVTSDGSIVDTKRSQFEDEEEEIINEMKSLNKPFVILLNTKNKNEEAIKLKNKLEEKYNMPVMLNNISLMTSEDFIDLIKMMLSEFPVQHIDIKMPSYLQALNRNSNIIKHTIEKIQNVLKDIKVMRDYKKLNEVFIDDEHFNENMYIEEDFAQGKIIATINPKGELFYKVLSDQSGEEIENEFKLVSYIKELSHAKKEYDRIKYALDDVKEFGYGVVSPSVDEMEYFEPEIIKKGNKYSVKLKAAASSYHILKVDVESEVSPIVASPQSEDVIETWLDGFEEKDGIWKSNMFGKTLQTLAKEGVDSKVYAISDDVKVKLRKALSRIINEQKGGVLCVLL